MGNSGKTRKSEIIRADPNFIKELREIAKHRYFKNLEMKEPPLSEMTRLLMRTESWKTAIWELRTKKRREYS
jgi:hypothetical protein